MSSSWKKENNIPLFRLQQNFPPSAGEYVRGKFHTNNMEGFWAIMKRGIYGIYHSVSHKHLHRYCNEFGYRYNTRELTGVERFEESVKQVSNTRLTYNELIGK